jgi:hypothetical protein
MKVSYLIPPKKKKKIYWKHANSHCSSNFLLNPSKLKFFFFLIVHKYVMTKFEHYDLILTKLKKKN